MQQRLISVVIPSYQRHFDLRRCLAAIETQSRQADEVIVVVRHDDLETLATARTAGERMHQIVVVYVEAPGLIAALNAGLDAVSGDIVVFTDDDSEPLHDWLERIEAAFAQDVRIGAVGGRDWIQEPWNRSLFQPSIVDKVGVITWYGTQHGNHHCPVRGHTQKVMFLKGVNMAFRSAAIGTYRIDLLLRGSGAQVGSEIDLCMHVRHLGFTVLFDDRILVKHYPGERQQGDGRLDANSSAWPNIYFNNHYLIAKHFNPILAGLYLANEILIGSSRNSPGLMVCIKYWLDVRVWRRFLVKAKMAVVGFSSGLAAQRNGSRHAYGL